jgi:hypothetical protein
LQRSLAPWVRRSNDDRRTLILEPNARIGIMQLADPLRLNTNWQAAPAPRGRFVATTPFRPASIGAGRRDGPAAFRTLMERSWWGGGADCVAPAFDGDTMSLIMNLNVEDDS